MAETVSNLEKVRLTQSTLSSIGRTGLAEVLRRNGLSHGITIVE
jgi:hypothetical protein